MRVKIGELLRLANRPAAPPAITLAAWLKRWLDSYADEAKEVLVVGRIRCVLAFDVAVRARDNRSIKKLSPKRSVVGQFESILSAGTRIGGTIGGGACS
jgi:hypothetical protein